MDKKETFIKAIKENEALLYKIASVYTNTDEDRNDLVQEIIYQLWKSFDSFSQQSTLTTWMYRAAMNTAIYHLKVTKRKIVTVPMTVPLSDYHDEGNNDMEDKWKLLRELISELNLLDKAIVILYLENKSYEEIAGIIGISPSNVGTKLSRIKEKLKQQIAKNYEYGTR